MRTAPVDAARPIGVVRFMPESAAVMPPAMRPMVGPVASRLELHGALGFDRRIGERRIRDWPGV